jgi:hypothetical protein
VEALNLRGLHAPLHSTRLVGRSSRGRRRHPAPQVDLREKGIAIAGTASREGDRVLARSCVRPRAS